MMPKQVQPVSPAAQAAPVGDEQLPPLQHGCVDEHDWPRYEQLVEPMSPDDGGGGTAPQVPLVWPGGTVHRRPAQQSASEVHTCVAFEQALPQRSVPVLSGRQGAPLQHSDENEQTLPAAMQHGAWPV